MLAPAAVVRLGGRVVGRDGSRSDLALTPGWLDGILELPLTAEARMIGAGHRILVGLSLLAVLRTLDRQ
jgi:hypothetical protein